MAIAYPRDNPGGFRSICSSIHCHAPCLSGGPAADKRSGRIRNRTGTQGATLSTCRWWDAPHVPVSRHSPVLFLVRSIKGNFLTSPHWHHQPLATPPRDVSHVLYSTPVFLSLVPRQ